MTQMNTKWISTHNFEAHEKPISSLAVSDCQNYLATSSADKSIKIWQIESILRPETFLNNSIESNYLLKLSGHKEGVSEVNWSSNGSYLVSGSDDHTVRLWDATTGDTISVLGSAPVRSIEAYLNGNRYANPTNGHRDHVLCCKFNPQSSLIVSGSADETVKIWDIRSSKCISTLLAHQEAVVSVDFSADGTLLTTSSTDGLVRVWDVASGASVMAIGMHDIVSNREGISRSPQCLRTFVANGSTKLPVAHAAFTANSKYILIVTLDGQLHLWDYKNDVVIREYSSNEHVREQFCVAAVDFMREENGNTYRDIVFSGSEDGKIYGWDVETEEQIDILCPKQMSSDKYPAVLAISLIEHKLEAQSKFMVSASSNMLNFWSRPA